MPLQIEKIKKSIFRISPERMDQLNKEIAKLFGEITEEEFDAKMSSFSSRTERLIEIINIKPRSSVVMDLKRNIEYKNVHIPKILQPLLHRHDVFYVGMGFRDKKWHIFYLSPLCRLD